MITVALKNHWNSKRLKLRPYTIFTRPSCRPSVILETNRPGNEASVRLVALYTIIILTSAHAASDNSKVVCYTYSQGR